jgi:hypothetical protein
MQVVETEGNPYELVQSKKSNIENSSLKISDITKMMTMFEQMNSIQITKITNAMINKTEEDITKFEKQNDEWITKITDAMINKTEENFSRFEEKNKLEMVFLYPI